MDVEAYKDLERALYSFDAWEIKIQKVKNSVYAWNLLMQWVYCLMGLLFDGFIFWQSHCVQLFEYICSTTSLIKLDQDIHNSV